MKEFITILFILFVSQSVYSQNNCNDEQVKRAKSIVQKLDATNQLRFAVENNDFGDCVHYSWMDEMRKFGIKQVTATLDFVWNEKLEKVEIRKIRFLSDYNQYNSELKDKKLLEQIEVSGLKKKLEELILENAKKHIQVLIKSLKKDYSSGLLKKEPKGKIRGKIYQNLLDDESLPILIDMPTIDF